MRIRVKVKGLEKNKRAIEKLTKEQTEKSMNNCMTDLLRVSSETTPLDKGDLEMSGEKKVSEVVQGLQGMVRFECWNKNPKRSYDFNYAIWIHEEIYNLGPNSKAKGGSSGLSGKFYPVGRKYLTRPLYGESKTYRDLIEKELAEAYKKR